jgi:hypothetical protein
VFLLFFFFFLHLRAGVSRPLHPLSVVGAPVAAPIEARAARGRDAAAWFGQPEAGGARLIAVRSHRPPAVVV